MRTATRRAFLVWTGAALIIASAVSSCTTSQSAQERPTVGSSISAPSVEGKKFEYQVGDYHIRLTFLDENSVHWEYLAAPDGLAGKNATENIDSMAIRDDILLVGWKEADGTQVLDVLDLGRMVIHANYVTASGERHSSQADLRQVE